MTFLSAVKRYLDHLRGTRFVPDAPSKSLSTYARRVWTLRNHHGVLAHVSKQHVKLPGDAC